MSNFLINPYVFGNGSDIENYVPPTGVPDPSIWYSPRNVTLSGSDVTVIANNGTAGSSYDQTPRTANLATIDSAKSTWNNRDVFNIPNTASGGYEATGDLTTTKTVITIATYFTGAETAFTGYDGLYDKDPGNVGAAAGFVGNGAGGLATTFTGLPSNAIVDGVAAGDQATVLPMDKRVVGHVSASNGSFNVIWHDEFSTSRNWVGFMGDMLVWTTELDADQIAAVATMLTDYYGT